MMINLLFIVFLILGYFFSYFLSKKIKLYDFPSKRKIHNKPTLCIGGIYIFCSIIFSFFFYLIIKNLTDIPIIYVSPQFIFNLLLSSSLILFLGILDDKMSIGPQKKILSLFLISLLFLSLLPNEMIIYEVNSIVTGKITLGIVGSVFFVALLFTIFIIFMGLIDGINCLLSSVSVFLFIILACFLNYDYFSFKNILLVMVLVYLFFFLIKNYTSKLFLGNSGAMILPFLIAVLYYINYENISNVIFSNTEIMPILIWLIIFDVLRVFLKRIKKNKSPFTPDKTHFHHFLIERFSLKTSLIIYLFLNFIPIIFILLQSI